MVIIALVVPSATDNGRQRPQLMIEQGLLRNLAILATVALVWTASQVAIRGAVAGGEQISINSLQSVSALIVRILTTPMLIIGFGLQALNGFLWIAVLSRMELSTAAPIMIGMYFAMLLLASRFLLDEPWSVGRLTGTALVGIGIWLILREG
jgi:drug/metabolite transporter (DMT)-like permease